LSNYKYNISCQIEDVIMQSFHNYQNTHPLMDTIPKNLDNFVSSVYPNPTTGKVQILINNTDNAILTLDIYNSIGKLVYKLENIEDDYIEIDISNQSSGLYMLKLYDNKSVKMIKKIIKQECILFVKR